MELQAECIYNINAYVTVSYLFETNIRCYIWMLDAGLPEQF